MSHSHCSHSTECSKCSHIFLNLLRDEPDVYSIEVDRVHRTIRIGYDEKRLNHQRAKELTQNTTAALAPIFAQCATNESLACAMCLDELNRPHLGLGTIVRQDPASGRLGVHRKGCFHGKDLGWWRESIPQWFQRQPVEPAHEDEWKLQAVLAGMCGVLTFLGWYTGERYAAASYALYIAAYIAGAWEASHEVWELLKRKVLDVHFLMLAVAAGALCIGQPLEGAVLLFLFSLSGALEHFAQGRTQKEITALLKHAPREVTKVNGSKEERVPVETLQPRDFILVRPGEQVAADGMVVEGESQVDESALTGESAPVFKTAGSDVLAGTLNQSGALKVQVTKHGRESTIQKVLQLITEAQAQKAPSQRFTDQFSRYYTWIVLAMTLGVFLFRWLGNDSSFKTAFYHSMVLMVVASPCALVLSIPSAILAAIATGARRGILFKGGTAIENLSKVDTVAMDKTGTVTTGLFTVFKTESFSSMTDQEILGIASTLESLSEHPIARAVVAAAKRSSVQPAEKPQNFVAHPGLGIEGVVHGRKYFAGTRVFLERSGIQIPESVALRDMGKTVVWLADEKQPLGRILLVDETRPAAKHCVEELHRAGKQVIMLTGDRRDAANGVAAQLGLGQDQVLSELLPDQKMEKLKALKAEGRKVAMVGDGVNDAPSMVLADVAIAMGSRGSDAALEQADVVLMHDRIENIITAFGLSSKASAIIRQNLVISLGTVVVLIILASLEKIKLTTGVVGHEGSTVLVCLNSLRLLSFKSPLPARG